MLQLRNPETLSILGIHTDSIVSVRRFGSSVEGKRNPNDYDYFVVVKNNSMKFIKRGGMPMPVIKNIEKKQFFIMPESEGENLLNAMLYTGRKDPDRMYSGKTLDITSKFKDNLL